MIYVKIIDMFLNKNLNYDLCYFCYFCDKNMADSFERHIHKNPKNHSSKLFKNISNL